LRDADRRISLSAVCVESEDFTRVSSVEELNGAGEARLVGGGEYGKRSTCRELMERRGRVGDFQWRLRRGRRERRSGVMSG